MAVFSVKPPTVTSFHSNQSNLPHHFHISKPQNLSIPSHQPPKPPLKNTPKSHISTTNPNTPDPNSTIQHLCSTGNLTQAINLLTEAKRLELDVEQESYISIIDLCERKRAEPESCQVYILIRDSNTQLGIRLGNSLLSMFVRLGDLGNAWYVFGKMSDRDLFSWNVLIGGYVKGGCFDECLDLYHRMFWAGFRPDVYSFPSVLKSCGRLADLGRGREVHVHVLRFGFESETDVNNSLISMYVKCGDICSARLVFDKMLVRDTISWNAMISGCFENDEFLEGLKLFLDMINCFVVPDLMTMTSVISACEFLGDEKLGRSVHGYSIKHKFGKDVSIDNSLIQFYSSIKAWEEAEKVFTGIRLKDVVSWTSMISGYEKNGLPEKAIEVFNSMKIEKVVPDEITIASVISACASLNLLDTGIELHECAKKTGFVSYVIVANALIDLYSKCKLIDKALEIFQQIRNKNVISWTSIINGLVINDRDLEAITFFRKMKVTLIPNSVTLISILSASGKIGCLTIGKEIHAYVLRTGLGFDGFVPNALLDMYVKCGDMDIARKHFNSIRKDIVSWNIMLRENGENTIELFENMVKSDMKPDSVTFISLLCACSRSGMVEKGFKYFNTMTESYGITPNLKHYACIVDLLGRAGELEEAYYYIKKMPIEPDMAIWGAFLNACRIHRNIELGELAVHNLFETNGSESFGYYTLVCNFYADIGKWDEVAKLKKLMTEKGVTIDPGCSWVEVKGSVHAFLTGDNTHPQEKEINAVLEGFYEKMEENTEVADVSKADVLCGHSERLAVGFGLINSAPGMPIRVTKNLYMCESCHNLIKVVTKVVRREISVRDTECFHLFKDGFCSCNDVGYKPEM